MAMKNQDLRSTKETRLQVAIATSRSHQQELLVAMATTPLVLPKMIQQVVIATEVTIPTAVQKVTATTRNHLDITVCILIKIFP